MLREKRAGRPDEAPMIRQMRVLARTASRFSPGVVCAGFAAVLATCAPKKEAPKAAAPEVSVVEVALRDVPIGGEITASVRGLEDVEIRARVEGYLESIDYREGSEVKKGQLLFTIDNQPYRAKLAEAKGELARNRAALSKADLDVSRFRPLAAERAVSQAELDNAVSAQNAARAQVDAAQASLEKASLDLGYADRLSAAASGTAPPQDDAGAQLVLADGAVYPERGRLIGIDRAVDPQTGTLRADLTFPNPKRLLRPGLYGKLRYREEVRKDALLVPQRAVQELQGHFTVVVVSAESKVETRSVKPGPRVGNLWILEEGVKPGEKVIVEGMQKVRDGMVVAATLAAPEPAPAAPQAAP